MWPLNMRRKAWWRPRSRQLREFVRRYKERLATLPAERLRLLEGDQTPAWSKLDLIADCAQTAKDFKQEMADKAEIKDVRPGAAMEYLFLSVTVKRGVDLDACRQRLPEFFRGYRVRCTLRQQ